MPPTPPPPPRPADANGAPVAGADLNTRLPWLCLGLALVLLFAVICGFVWFGRSTSRQREIAAQNPPATVPAPNTAAKADEPLAFLQPQPEQPVVNTPPETPAIGNVPVAPIPTSTVDVPTGTIVVSAFDDLRRRNFLLELPGRGIERDPADVKLADVPSTADEPLTLALHNESQTGIKLSPRPDTGAAGTVWVVQKAARTSLGIEELEDIAQFSHRHGELHFQWNAAAAAWAKPGSLQFSPLELQAGSQRQVCLLWKPVATDPLRINSQQAVTQVEIPIAGDLLDPPQRFRVQFDLAEVPYPVKLPAPVALGETAIVVIGNNPEQSVELQLRLSAGTNRSSLMVALFGQQPLRDRDGEGIRLDRREVSLTEVAAIQGRLPKGKARTAKKGSVTTTKQSDQLSKKEQELEEAESQREKYASLLKSTSSTASRQRYEALSREVEINVERLTNEVDQLRMLLGKRQSVQELAEELTVRQAAWCESVLAILRGLHDQARLRYSITADGQPPVPVAVALGASNRSP